MRVHPAWRPLLVALALTCLPALPGQGQDCTLVVEGTRWLWRTEPAPPGWTELAHDDDPERSNWQVGCAPFSSNGCGFAPGTYWAPATNLVLRQHVFLTGTETGFVANLAIDNDFELYVNGSFVGSLVHEGCATRWDASLPVPDALWQPGDNVLAVRAIDRGGITNFEFTLTATAPDGCPPGCAQLPCDDPGPALVVADWEPCPGEVVPLHAEAPVDPRCPSDFEYRFLDEAGVVVRGWGSPDWWGLADGDGLRWQAQVRCAYSPTCPVGSLPAEYFVLPGPPADPGPVLRVRKAAASVVVEWPLAAALGAREHEHPWAADSPAGEWSLLGGEGRRSPSWSGVDPGSLRCYRLRRADRCERESPSR